MLLCQNFSLSMVSPDSLETFQDSCERNFLCLQMISFEFLRAASIGWTVSCGKHFVHMTQPGACDWPAASFPRPISHTMMFILGYDTSTSSNEFNSPNYSILFSMVFELFLCGLDGYICIYVVNVIYRFLIACHTMWILTHAFSLRLFSHWMQLWYFKLVWMIVHERFKGNLRLQLTWKVSSESGHRIPTFSLTCVWNRKSRYTIVHVI